MALSKDINIAIGVTFVISLLLGMVMLWIILNYVPSAASTLLTGYNGSSNNGGPTQVATVGTAKLSGVNQAMLQAGSGAAYFTNPMQPGYSSASVGIKLNALPRTLGSIWIGIVNGKPKSGIRVVPYAGLMWDLQAQSLTQYGTANPDATSTPISFAGTTLAITRISINSIGHLIVDGTDLGLIAPAPQGAYLTVAYTLPVGISATVQFAAVI